MTEHQSHDGEIFHAVHVKREEAEEHRKELQGLGLVDPSRKIVDTGEFVEIPVIGLPKAMHDKYKLMVQEKPQFRQEDLDPYQRIVDRANIEKDLKPFLPRKWELLGEVVVLKLPKELVSCGEAVAQAYAEEFKAKAVLRDLGIDGEFREPKMEVLWSKGTTETVHTENMVKFALDPMKVMFSSGNIDERIRMATVPKENETVVDMFAGIGYFSVPIAVHSKVAKVVACEKNPAAFEFLEKNIELNNVKGKVQAILGDNREAPERIADRVIMGYLPTPREFLSKAIRILKRNKDCVIHYHENAPENEIPWALYSRVAGAAGEPGRGAKLLSYRWIKSYKPRIWHAVVDVKIL
jgi:tRNA wybutosine-synthesizing protein 2